MQRVIEEAKKALLDCEESEEGDESEEQAIVTINKHVQLDNQ